MRTALFLLAAMLINPPTLHAQIAPLTTCDEAGIGATRLTGDGGGAAIVDVSSGTTSRVVRAVTYCLVKVRVPQAIHIWVGLPMGGAWNGRLQSVGGGGYAGIATTPEAAIMAGYVGVTTDTGHSGRSGEFGMLAPGKPNTSLQIDFAYRSEHLMAVIGRELTTAFYGRAPAFTYWNGCSTGGRQGLMMAQRFPDDYNGIVAGAPAIHWDRFQAAMLWPQVVMRIEVGGPMSSEKLTRATNAAIAACDAKDGVVDRVIDDPRTCHFDARELVCKAGDEPDRCLTEREAVAINRIWEGPIADGKRLWYAPERGAALNGIAGSSPFPLSVDQPRYWVYFDPAWNWQTLDYGNYAAFFDRTVTHVGPLMATDSPDLSRFRDRGGKVILWHGWADQLIMPQGTIDYYERVDKALGGGEAARRTARLFMAPGVAHCGGGEGPAPQDLVGAIVKWVEQGEAPDAITAARRLPDGTTRTRPLCLYPQHAIWKGTGSTDDAANFVCQPPQD